MYALFINDIHVADLYVDEELSSWQTYLYFSKFVKNIDKKAKMISRSNTQFLFSCTGKEFAFVKQ